MILLLLVIVELHDLLHGRRRRAVDQVVVVLDGGPRRRQGDGAEERSFPKRNLPVADAGATSESSFRRGVSPPSYLSYSSLAESALAGSTDP